MGRGIARRETNVNITKPRKLVDLVKYQKESVVSRTLFNKKAGNLTLFAFDQGQGLSEHTSPFEALIYILDGEAEIVIDEKTMNASEGEMVKIPANKPHSLRAIRRFKMILLMIRSRYAVLDNSSGMSS